MRPHLSLLFLIIFSFVLCASADNGVPQDSETRPGASPESDTHAKWTEFVSFLDPAHIADKIQEASFISNILGNHLAEKSDADSLDSGPELQQSLDALFSEETGKIIKSVETVVNSTIALGMALYDVLESMSSDVHSSNASVNPLLKNVARLIVAARDDFQARFPFPATAPGHAQRAKSVSDALEHLQRIFIRLTKDHEIEQAAIGRYLARVNPFLHDMGVLIGDVSELYPAVIEALVLNLSTILLPEAVFLRSMVILYCFGPYVLGRDAISGWLLKHVSEDLKI